MSVREMHRSETPVRAGALTLLSLFSPEDRADLRRALDDAASGANVEDLLFEPVDQAENEEEGEETDLIVASLGDWMRRSPGGPMRMGEPDATEACTGLLFSWVSTLIHSLAFGPLGLTEMRSALPTLKPTALRTYVDMMERSGMLETVAGEDGVIRYRPTAWLRYSVAPLVAAARMERRHPLGDTAPPDSLDSGAAFMLTLPLLELPPEPSGACRLGVVVAEGGPPRAEGVTARVEGGRVVSVSPGLAEDADAWATADAGDWMDTVIEPDAKRVKTGGDKYLARVILDGLHETLFPLRPDHESR